MQSTDSPAEDFSSDRLHENDPEHTLTVPEDLSGVHSTTEKACRKDRCVSVSWPLYGTEQSERTQLRLTGTLLSVRIPLYEPDSLLYAPSERSVATGNGTSFRERAAGILQMTTVSGQ